MGANTKICKHFVYGKCTFGEFCRYEHPNYIRDIENNGEIYYKIMTD